jgi:hypothetical protein
MARLGDPRAGYALLDQIRHDGNKTPFIIYSGSRSRAFSEEARRRGALGSTNSPHELFEMVLSVLKVDATRGFASSTSGSIGR